MSSRRRRPVGRAVRATLLSTRYGLRTRACGRGQARSPEPRGGTPGAWSALTMHARMKAAGLVRTVVDVTRPGRRLEGTWWGVGTGGGGALRQSDSGQAAHVNAPGARCGRQEAPETGATRPDSSNRQWKRATTAFATTWEAEPAPRAQAAGTHLCAARRPAGTVFLPRTVDARAVRSVPSARPIPLYPGASPQSRGLRRAPGSGACGCCDTPGRVAPHRFC